MIRKAALSDIDLIEDTYNAHFRHERKQEEFTVFKKAYPHQKGCGEGDTFQCPVCL